MAAECSEIYTTSGARLGRDITFVRVIQDGKERLVRVKRPGSGAKTSEGWITESQLRQLAADPASGAVDGKFPIVIRYKGQNIEGLMIEPGKHTGRRGRQTNFDTATFDAFKDPQRKTLAALMLDGLSYGKNDRDQHAHQAAWLLENLDWTDHSRIAGLFTDSRNLGRRHVRDDVESYARAWMLAAAHHPERARKLLEQHPSLACALVSDATLQLVHLDTLWTAETIGKVVDLAMDVVKPVNDLLGIPYGRTLLSGNSKLSVEAMLAMDAGGIPMENWAAGFGLDARDIRGYLAAGIPTSDWLTITTGLGVTGQQARLWTAVTGRNYTQTAAETGAQAAQVELTSFLNDKRIASWTPEQLARAIDASEQGTTSIDDLARIVDTTFSQRAKQEQGSSRSAAEPVATAAEASKHPDADQEEPPADTGSEDGALESSRQKILDADQKLQKARGIQATRYRYQAESLYQAAARCAEAYQTISLKPQYAADALRDSAKALTDARDEVFGDGRGWLDRFRGPCLERIGLVISAVETLGSIQSIGDEARTNLLDDTAKLHQYRHVVAGTEGIFDGILPLLDHHAENMRRAALYADGQTSSDSLWSVRLDCDAATGEVRHAATDLCDRMAEAEWAEKDLTETLELLEPFVRSLLA